MKVVEQTNATGTLAEYTAQIASGAVIVTSEGRPVAALVPIENADLKTASLSTSREFLDLIDRSRKRAAAEGGVSSEEMQRRFQ